MPSIAVPTLRYTSPVDFENKKEQMKNELLNNMSTLSGKDQFKKLNPAKRGSPKNPGIHSVTAPRF